MLACYDSGVRTLREPSDDALAAAVTPETFLPHLASPGPLPFHLLPQLSERNVLSYAFASGMLAEACPL
jgi:hypothetical protein